MDTRKIYIIRWSCYFEYYVCNFRYYFFSCDSKDSFSCGNKRCPSQMTANLHCFGPCIVFLFLAHDENTSEGSKIPVVIRGFLLSKCGDKLSSTRLELMSGFTNFLFNLDVLVINDDGMIFQLQ